MIEVFQPPRITREETAYKMLFHVFAAFAALAVSMAGLFYSMAGDSRKNRDALHKVTSPETELWAIIVFAVFVLAAVYLSVAGVVLSRWVKKGGKLYFVSASASNVRASGSSRRISSSLKLQDASLNVLNDSGALEDILNGKTAYAFIQAIPVTSVTWVRQRKRGTKVYFQNKKVFLSKKMYGYHVLLHLLEEISTH